MVVSATFCPIIGLSEITSKKSPASRSWAYNQNNGNLHSRAENTVSPPPQAQPASAHRQIQTPRRSLFPLPAFLYEYERERSTMMSLSYLQSFEIPDLSKLSALELDFSKLIIIDHLSGHFLALVRVHPSDARKAGPGKSE
ncbi:hypothetical protein PGTUg99_014523 [Puccinia graminis f. sp. tritici]|uniref:Uncharacterized protein n=1 Tax=Puccinia graminis f. sp. tritici TaxID=56615 RepID=A0A5B0LJT3_PUCGR|nr:hypothetical protein PGTUg99_014523 [Puccinia graminis f. sp. tritici]